MLLKTDEYLKGRYIWMAKRHSMPSVFNFFYDYLSQEQQAQLSSHIDESLTGIPVLLFTKPGVEWTLLCTRQVVGFDGQAYYAASLSDIEKLQPSVMVGLDSAARLWKAKEVGKADFDQLTATMKNGEHVLFHAFKGPDFYAMWSVLLTAVRLNDR